MQYVAAAGVSLVSTLFVRAHHLDHGTKRAVLGLDRTKQAEQQSSNSVQGLSIELVEHQEGEIRS